jgi:hypothetical protein
MNWRGEPVATSSRCTKCAVAELRLVERDGAGNVLCPHADLHIDMHVHHETVVA